LGKNTYALSFPTKNKTRERDEKFLAADAAALRTYDGKSIEDKIGSLPD
jgi:hypothetical protein